MKAKKNNPDYFIVNATEDDFSTICRLFEEAISFQKRNNFIGWSSYDKDYLKADIQNGLLFKMIKDGQIISIFSICHNDILIWRERENGNAVYLHRIILNQVFKGEKVFRKILDWAIEFSKKNKLKHIRMDTWADNDKIIEYYKSYGFKYVETYRTANTSNLPLQHRNLKVTMLEFSLEELLR